MALAIALCIIVTRHTKTTNNTNNTNMRTSKNLIDQGLDNEKISLSKLMCLLSIILFLSGIALDYFSAPLLLTEILTLRLAMCALLSAVLCFITFKPELFIKYYSISITIIFLSASLTIQLMIFLTDPTDIAHSTYFAGLMLVILTVFLGSYLPTYLAIFLSIFVISSFLVMSYLMKQINFALAVNNAFFLGSALIVGVISNSMKNKFLAHILLLQKSLKESLRDQHKETKKQSDLANIDSITNIPNRRYGSKLLEKMIENADKLDMLAVIYFIDLNGFKQINDTYGHSVGDDVLNIVASRIELIGRSTDVFYRQSGDEFIFGIMIEKNNMDFISSFKQGIKDTIKPVMVIDGLRIGVSASVGEAVYPINGNSVSSLLHVADVKMYENKANTKMNQRCAIPCFQLPTDEHHNRHVIDISKFINK